MGKIAGLLLLWVGCDLISSDLTRVTVQLPIETYTVDTSDNTNVKLPETLPDVHCNSNNDCCPYGCSFDGYTIACAAASGGPLCQATIKASLVTRIDLSADPNLARARSVADVTLKSIQYAVCDNTLNVELPAIELWLAPETVTKPDPALGAKKLGTIAALAPGAELDCPADPSHPDPTQFATVMLEPDAQKTFASFAQNFKMRFSAIAVATLVEKGGQPVPSGAMTLMVTGQMTANLSL